MVVARKSFVAVAAVCFKAVIVLMVHSSQMWLLLERVLRLWLLYVLKR